VQQTGTVQQPAAANPATTVTGHTTTTDTAPGGGTDLPWELGGGAAVLAAGAGLLFATRRRTSTES
jgi:hypothetical protein